MSAFYDFLEDFLALFFPELCAACGENLFRNEQVICTDCIYNLPVTNFHLHPDNKLSRQLWGRFPFVQASSFVYFQKGNRVQNIMHQLKYNNRPETGFRMGELYGYELNRSAQWLKPELIIPVPLHSAKLRKRKYNQSELIVRGMASIIGIPLSLNNLKRIENTETQTRKSRFARYENLKDAFMISKAEDLKNKHILLVDDVMTTGATLEACSIELLKIEGLQISIATIAFAE